MDHKEETVRVFCDECVWIRSIRDHFELLYESGEQRKKLLSEISNGFFSDLNIILLEYILLQKAKLTDPASSGKGKDNLSTNYVVSLEWPLDIEQTLSSINERINRFREKIIDARRKLLAHSDLKSHLERIEYGEFTVDDEKEFWIALKEFANTAHMATFGEPFEIESTQVDGDAHTLVHALKEAIDYGDIAESDPGFLLKRSGKCRYEDA